MSGIQVVIVTPESTVLDRKAEFVALPLIDGEIGVLAGRAPAICRLGYGDLRIREGNKTEHVYVDGGFVQIADNVVTVLTGNAVPASKLNAAEVRERLALAESESERATGAEIARMRHKVAQAKSQLRILEKVQA
jgi:F-type H+-transporting ATPase subunit epsilon